MCSQTTSRSADGAELGALPLERLEAEITELAAHINAATCRWLGLVGEFDRREGWAEWGCRSCTHWLTYRCGLSPAAAREQVRVARAIADLPEIRSAFERGELCYSQVRALTRVASVDTEADLGEIARHATAAQLETIVRAYRGVLEVELGSADQAHRRRYVRCEHDDDGALLIAARLPAEEGALVLAALQAGRDALREQSFAAAARSPSAQGGSASAETTQIGDTATVAAPEPGGEQPGRDQPGRDLRGGGQYDGERHDAEHPGGGQLAGEQPGGERRDGEPGAEEREGVSNADALLLMAQTLLSSGPAERSGADSYQLVVHVDAATLAADDGACELEGGPVLHPETARRLACDASVVRILERDGRPLSAGRKTRSVAPALRRALRSRDKTCRFPGCCQRRFLHAHHIEHWARGGRTDLSNLVQLCRYHHRLVHEGGYTIERRSRGGLGFRRPDGLPLPAVPKRARGEQGELPRRNHTAGLTITDRTCGPRAGPDRLYLAGVVDGLAEADPRLRESEART